MSTKLDDFDVLELIGCGSFGSCYKVRNRTTNELLVWKVIEYGCLSEEKKQLLVTEVSLLRDLRHPNIVRYFDRIVRIETKQLYILIEYCSGGDLATVIKTCQRSNTFVEETFVWRVIDQLSSALQACHSQLTSTVILHRDIKPANVFLDEKGNVKLGDFGLACKLDVSQPGCVETMVGTPFYMSPEVMKGELYNSKSDVWSLGCLAYELCALKPPFHAQNIKELAVRVSKGLFERIPSRYSENLQKVLSNLLQVSQDHRPSIFDLVQNPLIRAHLSQCDFGDPHKSLKRPIAPPKNVNTRAPPPSPADREPEKVSKDTFQSEWLSRLQNLRDREAALRHRELQVEEKERSLNRREHRLALMERAVRDKLVLAEVYLKRSRECRSGSSGPFQPKRSPDWNEIEDSFSADAGNTSIMPTTSALLDPTSLPKPASFQLSAGNNVKVPERRVHFDQSEQLVSQHGLNKPSFLRVADAIRCNKVKYNNVDPSPRIRQKVLHLPGYTGPAITVDVPSSDSSDILSKLNSPISETQSPRSPSVKLTVLYDDREELQKATNQIDALNLETTSPPRNYTQPHYLTDAYASKPLNQQDTFPVGTSRKKNNSIAASVDSLLDSKMLTEGKKTTFSENFRTEVPFHNEFAMKRSSLAGSMRRRKKSISRSTAPTSTGCKSADDKSRESLENAKNNALLMYQKDEKTQVEQSKRKSLYSEKENYISKERLGRSKSVATSLLAIPSVAAAAASVVVSRSKKSQISYLR